MTILAVGKPYEIGPVIKCNLNKSSARVGPGGRLHATAPLHIPGRGEATGNEIK